MIFYITDPLDRQIVLKNETWEYKIICGHPEVRDYLPEIQQLISNPYFIVKDLVEYDPGVRSVHPTREEYFDIFPSRTTSGIILLRAVVDHATNPGEIVTIMESNRLKGLTTEGGTVYVRSEENKNSQGA